MRLKWAVIASVLVGCSPALDTKIPSPETLQSGYEFLTPETQALQDDVFENPAMLWVDRGEALFKAGDNAPSCASCHAGETFSSAAARFPKIEKSSGALVNLEGRINLCRIEHQDKSSLPYESDDLLALTSFVAKRAKGLPRRLNMTPKLQQAAKRGEAYFHARRGQMNLPCAQCHNAHWGQKLRGDTISQGHAIGFPTYRFEWENVGSLHRRLSDCDIGVRAQPKALGSKDYLDLEVYLALRAEGLPLEAPSVRR